MDSPISSIGTVEIHTSEGFLLAHLLDCAAAKYFVSLCEEGFYNEVNFERLMRGFIIKTGGTKRDFPALADSAPLQFADGAGIVALTRHSELFLTLDKCNALDAQPEKYKIVGKISDESLKVLAALADRETDASDRPVDPPVIHTTWAITHPTPPTSTSTSSVSLSPASPSSSASPSVVGEISQPRFSFTMPASSSTSWTTLSELAPSPSQKKKKVSFDSFSPSNNISADTSAQDASHEAPAAGISFPLTTSRASPATALELPPRKRSHSDLSTAGLLFGERTTPLDSSPFRPSPSASAPSHSLLAPSLYRQGTLLLDEMQPLFTAPQPVVSSHAAAALHMARAKSMPNVEHYFANVRPKYPKRLVIVRHGQSDQNAALDLLDPDIGHLTSVRDADTQLTTKGKWQAAETGKYLASTEKFDLCFCSPYDRTIQTAESLVAQLPYQLKIYKDNRLREKEFGRLHGMDDKTIKSMYPDEYKIRMRDGKYWYHFPGGENYPAVEMRVHSFLEKISRDCAGRSVLVITHQVPYKMFRALFEHLDEKGVITLPITPNCGVQEYVLDRTKTPEGRMKLKLWDYVAYDSSKAPANPVTKGHSVKAED